MTITPFAAGDIPLMLELAGTEGWLADAWEFDFLLSRFPDGCFTARDGSGAAIGFVTALLHERSGWIGNLIVAEERRGAGYGALLFEAAHAALRSAGAATIWLTASKAGRPLYERYGFEQIDTIVRWAGTGRSHDADVLDTAQTGHLSGDSRDLDRQIWGDRRDRLLDVTAERGTPLQNDSGFIVTQPCDASLQIGPFAARDDRGAELLLRHVLSRTSVQQRIIVDAPAANRDALRLFNRKRMRIVGTTDLMFAGEAPHYHPEQLYGLATMGSCG